MRFFGIPLTLTLSGCLYTGHHFNTGNLLPPGESHWELGVGTQKAAHATCSESVALEKLQEMKTEAETIPNLKPQSFYDGIYPYARANENGERVCVLQYDAGYDSIEQRNVYLSREYPSNLSVRTIPNLSLGWRLGVREKWGPLTGIDLGWRLETPISAGIGTKDGFPTLEFDTRIGLPLPDSFERLRHNVSLGWGIGLWADNSLFAEYALGWGTGRLRPFASTRVTYLASQLADLATSNEQNQFETYRRWIGQIFLGCEWTVLKMRLMPTASLAWPGLPFYGLDDKGHAQGDGLDFRMALGVGAAW